MSSMRREKVPIMSRQPKPNTVIFKKWASFRRTNFLRCWTSWSTKVLLMKRSRRLGGDGGRNDIKKTSFTALKGTF